MKEFGSVELLAALMIRRTSSPCFADTLDEVPGRVIRVFIFPMPVRNTEAPAFVLTTPDSLGSFTYSVFDVSKYVWSENSGSGTFTFCAYVKLKHRHARTKVISFFLIKKFFSCNTSVKIGYFLDAVIKKPHILQHVTWFKQDRSVCNRLFFPVRLVAKRTLFPDWGAWEESSVVFLKKVSKLFIVQPSSVHKTCRKQRAACQHRAL